MSKPTSLAVSHSGRFVRSDSLATPVFLGGPFLIARPRPRLIAFLRQSQEGLEYQPSRVRSQGLFRWYGYWYSCG